MGGSKMVDQGTIIGILTGAITTVIFSAAPMLLTAMVIGLLVSIFQATTQINEQTLAFVPKIVGVMLALLLFSGFIFNLIGGFVTNLYQSINTFMFN
jgi:flagellar biosynthetic protein FliQ